MHCTACTEPQCLYKGALYLVSLCTWNKIQHHHILCLLFVRGLAITLLFGGLGVEDQENDLSPCYLFLRGQVQQEVYRSQPASPDELERQILDTSAAVPLHF